MSALLKAESEWDIRPEVAREWGPTFDNFLRLYNTQDLKTIMISLRPGENEKRCTVYEKHRRENKLPISELKNWMKPKFKPSIWKKYLCKEQYLRDKEMGNKKFDALFGEGTDNSSVDLTRVGITRVEFIDGIMEEIRNGDKEV